jgi:hypothetical protein
LEYGLWRKKVIFNKLKDFSLIDGGVIEYLRARGGHGCKIGKRKREEKE